MVDTVFQQGRSKHGNFRPGHHRFQHALMIVHTAGDRDVSVDMSAENRHPVQSQEDFVRTAQGERRDNFAIFEVEIRLIKPIEQHESVGTGFVEPLAEIGNGGEMITDLHRDRY